MPPPKDVETRTDKKRSSDGELGEVFQRVQVWFIVLMCLSLFALAGRWVTTIVQPTPPGPPVAQVVVLDCSSSMAS